jgi:hypothetical protein
MTMSKVKESREWLDSGGYFIFGKYGGPNPASVEDVAREDSSYLRWILMKHEILCQTCANKPSGQNLSYAALLQRIVTPPDHTRRVSGPALHSMRCDHCNVTILPSDLCTCVSTWNSGGYFSWESDYLSLEVK